MSTQLFTPRTQPPSAEISWQVHSALEAWIARADIKASVLLTLQGAAVAFIFADDATMARGWAGWTRIAALVGLLLATCVSASTIVPVLGSRRRLKAEYSSNMIYFGHLRLWKPSSLAERLQSLSDEEQTAMLARQLVFLSRIAWHKHQLLQVAVSLTVLMIIVLVAVRVAPA